MHRTLRILGVVLIFRGPGIGGSALFVAPDYLGLLKEFWGSANLGA